MGMVGREGKEREGKERERKEEESRVEEREEKEAMWDQEERWTEECLMWESE
jgi:hypothetical protein